MDAEGLFGLLNRYFEAIAAPVLQEQPLPDKFIGDALMAEFGVPVHRGDRAEALAAVRAAPAMQANFDSSTESRRRRTSPLRQYRHPLWRSDRRQPRFKRSFGAP